MKRILSRTLLTLGVIVALIIGNGCYWVFSDIQTQCAEKIIEGHETSLYDKASILSLHLGICTVGALYCQEAAYANFMMLITRKDTVYLHSDKWITPKVKARLENQQWGKMAWNGDIDYAFRSPEKDGAILLNWCTLASRPLRANHATRQRTTTPGRYPARQPSSSPKTSQSSSTNNYSMNLKRPDCYTHLN